MTFAGVLWGLSNDFIFHVGDRDYTVPGFMVWAAILYASAGSLLSYWVGRGLIGRNAERYAREADLRFSLVRVNEHVDDISSGARARRTRDAASRCISAMCSPRRAASSCGHANLTWVTAGFGWVTIVAPILVAAPLYFSGKVSFGGLMMAAGAFSQAQSSLRWFIDNFSAIADWRATLLRVANFRQALDDHARTAAASKAASPTAKGSRARFPSMICEIVSSANADMLKESKVVVKSGRARPHSRCAGHRQDAAVSGIGGTVALGRGRHHAARRGEQIFYLPRGTPYMPRGTLREVLAYPLKAESFDDGAFARALYRLGLERLAPLLDATHRWDRELSQDEQLCLAIARILLQAPPWVLIDGTFGSLDDDVLELVIDVFSNELERTGVIHIGGAGAGASTVHARPASDQGAPIRAGRRACERAR